MGKASITDLKEGASKEGASKEGASKEGASRRPHRRRGSIEAGFDASELKAADFTEH